jgi:hypothetical protein
VDKATWLEGCFTPEGFKDDPRLLLGFHHHSWIGWEFDAKSSLLCLTVSPPRVRELEAYHPLTFYYNDDRYIPRERLLKKMWKTAIKDREETAAIQTFFRELNALVGSGKLDRKMLAIAWHVLPEVDMDDYECTLGYYVTAFCQTYADAIEVDTDSIIGYQKPVSLSLAGLMRAQYQSELFLAQISA